MQERRARARNNNNVFRFLVNGEWPVYLILTLFFLLAFGLISLFSASHVTAYINSGDSYEYIKKQAIYAIIGLTAMFIIARIDYHWLDRWVLQSYAFGIFLLAVVQFTCDPLNGAKRWLYWDTPFLSFLPVFQVSEIVKFIMILVTARILCYVAKTNPNGIQGLIYPMIPTFFVVLFVYNQPHLSGTVIILAIVIIMIIMSGVGVKFLVVGAGLAAVGGYVLYQAALNISYVQDRLSGWTLDVTQMDWQTKQSVYAIGSGGLYGLGFGNGVQKQLWLPEATNDFIFSVICEELGFIGAMFVIFLFVAFIAQGFHIALQASDLFGTLLAIGISAQIALQFAFNIGVVTSLLPNTGISLPFFSSGGTSLLMLLAEVGVLISVARDGKAAKARALLEEPTRQTQAFDQARQSRAATNTGTGTRRSRRDF